MANATPNKAPRGNRAAPQGANAPAAPDAQRLAPPSGSNTPDLTGGAGQAPEQPDAGTDIEGYWIRSVPETLRRAGRRFTQEGAGFALDLFGEDELALLREDPNLVVERVTFSNEGVVSR